MGQCVSTMPETLPDHEPKRSMRTSTTASSTPIGDDDENKPKFEKHDYESILTSPGQLPIPEKFIKWFPPRHGHRHIRKLFKWHVELGHGVTGSVHEIEYKQQICAVKQIPKHDQWGRMLFTTEARVLSKLRHCGIIGFIDMFFDEKYYYLVLEKADFDLYYVMKKKGHLSERKTRNITYALLKAISYMHKKNLVHRDLKPENIVFISTDTNQPRLIDFGDAEMAKKDQIYTEFVGTPPYMSPERLDEHRGWQLKKADIWALAVIAYEMYCGRRCFEGDTQKQVFGRILRGEWSWPSNRKQPSDNMKDFINLCLSANAKDRPSANTALQHKWFDIKRKEENDEEQKRQILLQRQLKLNDAPSAAISLGDEDITSVGSYLNEGISIFENLASMVESNPLQDILVKGYISSIKDDDLGPYKQQFEALDRDGDGFITGCDLVTAFTNNGIGPNEASSLASIILSQLDAERRGHGKISFKQFLAARIKYDLSNTPRKVFDDIVKASNHQLLTPNGKKTLQCEMHMSKQISNGFESEYSTNHDDAQIVYCDEDYNGISRDDILFFTQSQMNLKSDEKESLHATFEQFDKDRDGKLTFADFVQAVCSTRVIDAPVKSLEDNSMPVKNLETRCRISSDTYTADT